MPIPGELTKTEATIAQIWKEVLNISTLRVSDNFFDLGGQSLLLMRATARIQRELAIPLPPMVMFQYPTVESLAAHIHTASENGAETSRRTAMESLTDLAARRRNAWAGLPA
jgi:Phosphopantetheine attachment site.